MLYSDRPVTTALNKLLCNSSLVADGMNFIEPSGFSLDSSSCSQRSGSITPSQDNALIRLNQKDRLSADSSPQQLYMAETSTGRLKLTGVNQSSQRGGVPDRRRRQP